MTTRELTIPKAELVHPEVADGRSLWLAPEVQDIVDRLHNGDSTLGWEGDPRLGLYRLADNRWQVCRLEHDGELRPVCTSRPGLSLDRSLILHLMAHDQRRGADPLAQVDAANTANQRERDYQATEKVHSAAERLQYALKKDLGHLY